MPRAEDEMNSSWIGSEATVIQPQAFSTYSTVVLPKAMYICMSATVYKLILAVRIIQNEYC